MEIQNYVPPVINGVPPPIERSENVINSNKTDGDKSSKNFCCRKIKKSGSNPNEVNLLGEEEDEIEGGYVCFGIVFCGFCVVPQCCVENDIFCSDDPECESCSGLHCDC